MLQTGLKPNNMNKLNVIKFLGDLCRRISIETVVVILLFLQRPPGTVEWNGFAINPTETIP